jgi:hypothetical protein
MVGAAMATGNGAKNKALKPTQQWSGSVEDESLRQLAPGTGVITDAKTFGRLWQGWKAGEQLPAVDFRSELVLVATTSGSRLQVGARLSDGGDLKVLGMATQDFRPGFRYQILTIPRDGVKTVDGRALAKDS